MPAKRDCYDVVKLGMMAVLLCGSSVPMELIPMLDSVLALTSLLILTPTSTSAATWC